MKHWLLLLLATLFAAPLYAADTPAKVRATLDALFPGQTPDAVTAAPLAGLYEVAFGPRIFYVSADGRYLVTGDLIDFKRQSNLTEQRRGAMRLAALGSLSNDSMIVYPATGTAKHTITVFTDIDCTYCRKLHSGMKEMNELGITVRYLAYPRAGVGSPSYDKAVAVWCSADRNQAMDLAKNEGKITGKPCAENPVQEQMAMGERVGVTGTPAIVLEDGRLMPGYLPPQRLLQVLNEQKRAAN